MCKRAHAYVYHNLLVVYNLVWQSATSEVGDAEQELGQSELSNACNSLARNPTFAGKI